MSSLKKKCQVLMLPTNEKANALRGYNDKSLLFNYKAQYDNIIEAELKYTSYFHLYILSDDEIKESDYVYDSYRKEILQAVDKQNTDFFNLTPSRYKKIIATTDCSLGRYWKLNEIIPLPQPSPQFITSFIEKYNKGNVITDVIVEYEEELFNNPSGKYDTLKVDKNNYITITKLKDSWNREEVVNLINKAFIAGYERSHSGYPNTDNHTKPKVEEFILNNL